MPPVDEVAQQEPKGATGNEHAEAIPVRRYEPRRGCEAHGGTTPGIALCDQRMQHREDPRPQATDRARNGYVGRRPLTQWRLDRREEDTPHPQSRRLRSAMRSPDGRTRGFRGRMCTEGSGPNRRRPYRGAGVASVTRANVTWNERSSTVRTRWGIPRPAPSILVEIASCHTGAGSQAPQTQYSRPSRELAAAGIAQTTTTMQSEPTR